MPEHKTTFIITSVIHFSQKKVLGSSLRSVFSPEDRTVQTLNTIRSIRAKVPGAFIILLEMGKNRNIAEELIGAVDKYVFIGQKTLVRWAVNGKFRGLGEAVGLITAKKDLNTGADFFFKISGRYLLNEHFDTTQWQHDLFSARKYSEDISTRLYGFNRKFFGEWQNALKRSLFQLYRGMSLEEVLPVKFGKQRIYNMQKIGVSGYTAPNGEYLEE